MLIHYPGRRTRRGVTLIEMLVTIAVLVIIMTILVQIFQAATGAVSAAQAYQALDDQLRRIDGILRADLEGTTAIFTPASASNVTGDSRPRNGYFEYGENEFADNQGEDCDDYIRFTAKAQPGQPFTGRMWVNYWSNNLNQQFGSNVTNLASFPITVTSDYAEIIYFLRNGNLYRRVLLVQPELQSSIVPTIGNTAINSVAGTTFSFQPSALNGNTVSWQGVNDLSARPNGTGPNSNAAPSQLAVAQQTIMLNSLADLANRENRWAYPRFANDFQTATANGPTAGPDGIPDDLDGDNIYDLYPSLYPGVFSPTNPAGQLIFSLTYKANATAISLLAFPYVFPGAYSRAQALKSDAYGWIHAPSPVANSNGQEVEFDVNTIPYLQSLNHNPLDVGDNLPTPVSPPGVTEGDFLQTWWGFPTWRETLSPLWTDPTVQINLPANNYIQPHGLSYSPLLINQGHVNPLDANLLPPMAAPNGFTGNFSEFRQSPQLFSDAAGQNSYFWPGNTNQALWNASWEDDLIMTGVRSFDVKAFDAALDNYADLGWGDDLRPQMTQTWASNAFLQYVANNQNPPVPFLGGNLDYSPLLTGGNPVYPPRVQIENSFVDYINQSFAHEGRMPPRVEDNRLDAQNPNPTYVNYTTFKPQYPAVNTNYSSNIGDDSNGIVRLRRVWDSWSFEYSMAPASGVNPNTGGFPSGTQGNLPPVYPSYPPPYPAPLRGIQIQIRVVDPTNQRIKSLTIRQDFTDKL
jgi:prepilin-type N-terminal cleavage/methylation domain-containing protein